MITEPIVIKTTENIRFGRCWPETYRIIVKRRIWMQTISIDVCIMGETNTAVYFTAVGTK